MRLIAHIQTNPHNFDSARDEIRKMARICDEHAALMRGDK